MDLAGEEDDGGWRSNLSTWKSRRKSHSSNQRLTDSMEDLDVEKDNHDDNLRRKPKTFKEMMEEKERRLGNFASYSYDDDIIHKSVDKGSSSGSVSGTSSFGKDSGEKISNSRSSDFTESPFKSSQVKAEQPGSHLETNEKAKPMSAPWSQASDRKLEAKVSPVSPQTIVTPGGRQEIQQKVVSDIKKYSDRTIRISQRPNSERGFGFSITGSVGRSIIIEKVTRGSSADVNELKAGDEILSMNGVDLTKSTGQSVQDVLGQAIKVGQIELKIRRLKDEDEDIFDDDEFLLSQERKKVSRPSFGSQCSTPPPSPPHLSFSDYTDDPPPLPALPPPPPNWNTFPDAAPASTKASSVLPQVRPTTDYKSEPREASKMDQEQSKEDQLRKRYEFLGLPVETSEEYKRMLEEKHEVKPSTKEPTVETFKEVKKLEASYLASLPSSDAELSLRRKADRQQWKLNDDKWKTNSQETKPDKTKDFDRRAWDDDISGSRFAADRARLKREAEERYNKEQEEAKNLSALRYSKQSPVDDEPPVLDLRIDREEQIPAVKEHSAEFKVGESLREAALNESRNPVPRDTVSSSAKPAAKVPNAPPEVVTLNVRGSESLPYYGFSDSFTNREVVPQDGRDVPLQKIFPAKLAVDNDRDFRMSSQRTDPNSNVALHNRILDDHNHNFGLSSNYGRNNNSFENKDRISTNAIQNANISANRTAAPFQPSSNTYAPKPYLKPSHSRSSSADILESESSNSLSNSAQQLPKNAQTTPSVLDSRSTSKQLPVYDTKVIIGQHNAPEDTSMKSYSNSSSPRSNSDNQPLAPRKEPDFSKESIPNTRNGLSPRQERNVTGSQSNSGALSYQPLEPRSNTRPNDFKPPVYSAQLPQYVVPSRVSQNLSNDHKLPPRMSSSNADDFRSDLRNLYDQPPSSNPSGASRERAGSIGSVPREVVRSRSLSDSMPNSNISYLLYGDGSNNDTVRTSYDNSNGFGNGSRGSVNHGRPSLSNSYGNNTARLVDNYNNKTSDSHAYHKVPSPDDSRNSGYPSNGKSKDSSFDKIPLSSKVVLQDDPYSRWVTNDIRFPFSDASMRVPSSSDYHSVPASDRFVNDLVNSRPDNGYGRQTSGDYRNNVDPLRSGNPTVSNQHAKPFSRHSGSVSSDRRSYSNDPLRLINEGHGDPLVLANSGEFVPLASRLTGESPQRNDANRTWNPAGDLSPRRTSVVPLGSYGNHWMVEEAERRRMADSSGQPRSQTLYRDDRVLQRHPSTSAQNLSASVDATSFRPNNYEQRKQMTNRSSFDRMPSNPSAHTTSSYRAPPAYSHSGSNSGTHLRSTYNPPTDVTYQSNNRSQIVARPSSSYKASGAVDSLFSHVGSNSFSVGSNTGRLPGANGSRDSYGNDGGRGGGGGTNLVLQRSNSRSQGSLHLDGTPQFLSSASPFAHSTNNIPSRYASSGNSGRQKKTVERIRCSVCGDIVRTEQRSLDRRPRQFCKNCFVDEKGERVAVIN